MKNKLTWLNIFKLFYFRLTIKNGYCQLYKKKIKNILDCQFCSVCNWCYRCEHFQTEEQIKEIMVRSFTK
jgi:hypothetical protein